MKSESEKYIKQANILLGRADTMMTVGLHEDAARTVYLASLHIAHAYVFERSGKASKSHNGLQTEFFRLSKDDRRTDKSLRSFLSQAYEFKAVADYFTGDDAFTSAAEAADAIATAKLFVTHFAALVPVSNDDVA